MHFQAVDFRAVEVEVHHQAVGVDHLVVGVDHLVVVAVARQDANIKLYKSIF